MFITVTVRQGDLTKDIRIDSEQKIGMCLKVLREAGKIPNGEDPTYFRSELCEKLVSAYRTFQDEGIYDGDVLTAVG